LKWNWPTGGKKLYQQIDEAKRVHEKVLLILPAESMSSEWVKTELAKARKREGCGDVGFLHGRMNMRGEDCRIG